MAGISFELRKVLRERTLGSIAKAFGYSTILSAGPYLISIITLISSCYSFSFKFFSCFLFFILLCLLFLLCLNWVFGVLGFWGFG
ncbi:MAG: exopolysaccharide Pel transporter PelG, partial [Aquificaceae bacterium]